MAPLSLSKTHLCLWRRKGHRDVGVRFCSLSQFIKACSLTSITLDWLWILGTSGNKADPACYHTRFWRWDIQMFRRTWEVSVNHFDLWHCGGSLRETDCWGLTQYRT